jgi:hypothetical protein
MSRISTTTLFNFTNSLEFLIDNLTNGIYCSENFEKLPIRNNGYSVPMACFCDIPLSLIKEHFEWYGRYGIGIKRRYARTFGVKPVWYVTSESLLVKSLINNKSLNEYEKSHLVPYLKQFMGLQEIEAGKLKRKKFYDEREWRYIPKNADVEFFFGNKQNSTNTKSQLNYRMKLDLNAIEYIILDNEKELEQMIEVLKKIQTDEVSYDILLSKILTSRQIERDF